MTAQNRAEPLDRLTPEEMAFRLPRCVQGAAHWNKNYALLIDEYCTALEYQDEGWISDCVSEVRKLHWGLLEKGLPSTSATLNDSRVQHRGLDYR